MELNTDLVLSSENLSPCTGMDGSDSENSDDDIPESTTILLPPPELPTVASDNSERHLYISGHSVATYEDLENYIPKPVKKVNMTANNCPPATNDNEDDLYEEILVPPDGGWGWMVLMGSIIVNILIPGTVKSFGILFIEFIEVFEASPAEAAWIPALSYWLYSSVGPFANALTVKYSHRAVTIAGGILASAGLMLSYFATSIPFLYVSYGIIGGLGAGLSYPIGVLVVGQYFDKLRGLANGLCTSGSALGSVIVPPLLRYLLVEYGYREAILIMGALLLNVCVGAMFFEPVERNMKKIKVLKEIKPEENSRINSITNSVPPGITSPQSAKKKGIMLSNHISIQKSHGGNSEMASSMPIAIPVQSGSQEIRGDSDHDRRGSGTIRRATFQIGHETPVGNSWSLKSTEGRSLLAMLNYHDDGQGPNISPNSVYTSQNIKTRSQCHLGADSIKDLDVIADGVTTPLVLSSSVSNMTASTANVASRCASRANLTAIPEDDDTGSETRSRDGDWNYYAELPAAKQRLIRLSMSSGNQLHLPTLPQGNSSSAGLSRTMSVASNVSSSSFHYVSTHHHGGMLAAMQLDKNMPQFASSITLKSFRKSCCSKLTDKCHFSFWRRKSDIDERVFTSDLRTDHLDSYPEKQMDVRPKKSPLNKFIDLSLLKDGMYLVMLLSNSTTAIGYTNFLIILPAYAVSLGFDKSEASWLLSIVAALDFVGRIGGSAISDLKFIQRKWYYIVGLFFSGVALIFLPMGETYASLAMFCALFGLASGTYVGVTAVLLADELGIERLGSSYGISLFVNGALQLAGPPICGSLVVWKNSYNQIITWLGIILVIGSMFWIATPFIERQRRNRSRENEKYTAQNDAMQTRAGHYHPQDTSSV